MGNLSLADRKIWNVLGNTPNLAARLEGLTRGFDALVVIDPLTHERAGPKAAGFEKEARVRVKGVEDDLDVWVLHGPLETGTGRWRVS